MLNEMLRLVKFGSLRVFNCGTAFERRLLATTPRLCRKRLTRRDPKRFDKKSTKPLIKTWPGMTVAELAANANEHPDDIFECILSTNYADLYEKETDRLEDHRLLVEIVQKLGGKCEMIKRPTVGDQQTHQEPVDQDVKRRPALAKEQCQPRHPVVTVMGHVDHGKTTLLDSLRNTNVVDEEFGAITQHLSAFLVPVGRRMITFLDTPGHAIFSKMRSRSAHATDIVVLVVAADDGVMEQTVESIRMARQAGVPIVVALNKCDKFGLDLDKVKRQLLAQDIVGEELGGDVQIVPISALKSENLDALCEAIIAQADLMDLRADYQGPVEGVVLESKILPGRGKSCVGLVQRGCLKIGSHLVSGNCWCKVRSMYDTRGREMLEAPPSTPFELAGWRDDLPNPGDDILQVENEKIAKQVIAHRQRKALMEKAKSEQEVINRIREAERQAYVENREKRLQAGYVRRYPKVQVKRQKEYTTHEGPFLNVVLKADVDGSLEAVLDVCSTYDSQMCKFDVVQCGVGGVTESDLEVAELFDAVIYCFNVPTSAAIREAAEKRDVNLKFHNVIYKLIDDVREEMNNRLPLIESEVFLGEAEVVQEFMVTEHGRKKSPVAGCRVTKGALTKQDRLRIFHKGQVVYDGEMDSMRRNKDVVSSATTGQEVGIRIADASVRFEPGDEVVCYKRTKNKQEIDWNPTGC